MTQRDQTTVINTVMEQLIEQGTDAFREVMTVLMNEAMQIDRETFIGAKAYERSSERSAYGNGFRPKRVDSQLGTLNLKVPKTRDHGDTPFYPQSLEQGLRSERAIMLCAAEMYVKGVSTRRVEEVLKKFGIEKISSTQVSRATALLDETLEAWRNRPLGEVRYLVLDARYERVRLNRRVVDAAVLSAVGILPDGHRSVLGVQVATSEAEVNWRDFLQSLTRRGMHGVKFIASDDHAGLKAARQSVFPGVAWQRCQFHLGQNAMQHAPTKAIKEALGHKLRQIWNAQDEKEAAQKLSLLVDEYRPDYPSLAEWLEDDIPEGFGVFDLPRSHRRKLRTTNGIERPIQQEIKRRSQLVRVFPNEAALLRLVSAVLIEIDEDWISSDKRYITWDDNNGGS